MARTGYLIRPPELTKEDRQLLRERMERFRAEREVRRAKYGPIDVAALVREMRSERMGDGPAGR